MKCLTPKDLKSLERTLAGLESDVAMIYFTEPVNCRHCRAERKLLEQLADLTHKLHLDVYNFTADREAADRYGIDKVPGLVLVGAGDPRIRYYGMPSDFEFGMLLEDILRVSSGESGLSEEARDRIRGVKQPIHLEVLTTPACPLSAGAVRVSHQIAMESDFISADLINVGDFPDVAERYHVLGAPTVVVNEDYHFYGALPEKEFVDETLKGARTSGA
jgi:glutaredoxin-like protein